MRKWIQEGRKLKVYDGIKSYFFIMPPRWKIENTSNDLFALAEILLFSPWDVETWNYKFTRRKSKNIGLALSTGVDSTAARIILGNSIGERKVYSSYMKRAFVSNLIHDNADRFISTKAKDTIVIESNHELIRTNFGLRHGFSTDLACLVHLVLLADYLKLGYISCGMVLETAYLRNGYEFREFIETDYFKKWSSLFSSAGLDLVFVTAGLSEVITNDIVNHSVYRDVAQSCLREYLGCNNCYKCFRKRLLNGKLIKMDQETEKALSKIPPKMASSVIYAMNKIGADIPLLEQYRHEDFSFLERYYPNYFGLLPKELRKEIENKVNSFCQPMSKEDIIKFKKVDLSEYG